MHADLPKPTCLVAHPHAARFCRAHELRHAIRVFRRKNRAQAVRIHVRFHRRRLTSWNVSVLWRVNRWERHVNRVYRGRPTWVVIRDLSSWACIHRYEAPGGWTEVDNNGGVIYHGGLQMDGNFEQAYGADMLVKYHGLGAEHWSQHDQLVVGQRGRDARGWQPWSTAGACGLA
jgi:hypothetical protein